MKMTKEYNHKKKYGQNFLDNEEILERIVENTNILEDENILEIGPGLGFLTKMFLEKKTNLICFEIDKDLIPKLNNKFSKYNNFNLINMDFLDANLEKLLNNEKKYKVIANIPYYITTPIIEKLLENKEKISEIYLMVQKEVGERICNEAGNKNRGIFSHIVQFFAKTEYLFTVEKKYFDPIPKVDSAFIKIIPYLENKYSAMIDSEKYFRFIKEAFKSKRKCLTNNLKSLELSKEKLENILENIGHSKNARAEELSIEDFINLIRSIDENR